MSKNRHGNHRPRPSTEKLRRCTPSHGLVEIPQNSNVRNILPQFAGVHRKEMFVIGTPCQLCASCYKPFTAARQPRLKIILYPIGLLAPIALQHRLCGLCARQYRAGGDKRDSVLAAIERFIDGPEVSA